MTENEVAVCYRDTDPLHERSHWAVGPTDEIVRWLLDEAADDPRRQAIITAISIRMLSTWIGLPSDISNHFEETVVGKIEPTK